MERAAQWKLWSKLCAIAVRNEAPQSLFPSILVLQGTEPGPMLEATGTPILAIYNEQLPGGKSL